MKNVISVEGIKLFLINQKISKNIKVFDSLESTNKTAKELAKAGTEDGTVVIADCQTAGKGRFGRLFFSPSGGIYMSIILRLTDWCFGIPTLVTAFAAVSVSEAIETVSGKRPKIKWVNDIYLNNKKICGILTEAFTESENSCVKYMIVGIGINFNTSSEEFPKELQQTAGSIFFGDHPVATRNRLIAEIINVIVASDRKYDGEELIKRYKKRLMILGENVLVKIPGETYKAKALDVDGEGRLIVKKDNGEIKALCTGEISIEPVHIKKQRVLR